VRILPLSYVVQQIDELPLVKSAVFPLDLIEKLSLSH